MNKHDQSQLLCDSFEEIRSQIGFDTTTLLTEVAGDKPALLVFRKHSFKVVSNYPAVKTTELVLTISVQDDGLLFFYNNGSDPESNDFHAVVNALTFPQVGAPA